MLNPHSSRRANLCTPILNKDRKRYFEEFRYEHSDDYDEFAQDQAVTDSFLSPASQLCIVNSRVQEISNFKEIRHPYPKSEEMIAHVEHLHEKCVLIAQGRERQAVPVLGDYVVEGEQTGNLRHLMHFSVPHICM